SAHLLRAQVIGVVIAGREHVGPNHDTAAHLFAKTGRARVLVHVGDVAPGNAQAVAHAVIAGEIGRGFRRRHDVVGRQGIFGVRKRHRDDVGAGGLKPLRAALPQVFYFSRHTVDAVLLRNADLHGLDRFADSRLVVRNGLIDRGRVFGVVPRHRGEQDGNVAHRARERPRLARRGSNRQLAPGGGPAVGRFGADVAGEGRRRRGGPPRIVPGGAGARARRDRRRRAARGAARHERRIRSLAPPRRDGRPE